MLGYNLARNVDTIGRAKYRLNVLEKLIADIRADPKKMESMMGARVEYTIRGKNRPEIYKIAVAVHDRILDLDCVYDLVVMAEK